jgi:hypothetical protein
MRCPASRRWAHAILTCVEHSVSQKQTDRLHKLQHMGAARFNSFSSMLLCLSLEFLELSRGHAVQHDARSVNETRVGKEMASIIVHRLIAPTSEYKTPNVA